MVHYDKYHVCETTLVLQLASYRFKITKLNIQLIITKHRHDKQYTVNNKYQKSTKILAAT